MPLIGATSSAADVRERYLAVVALRDAIPIDGQVMLADSYIDSPVKKVHIGKANKHFAKGDCKAATDELRLAEVDASFSRVLMPLDATARHVAEAMKLLAEHKYYESNLALKAVQDGLRTDSIVLSEMPIAQSAAKSPAKQDAAKPKG